ncbi:MAG: preprotein translocase subunit Sec61beta [Aigarchaeota archaeon]|nr:preprotein translocase subunit Sec61beta [Aigarchaeota archaeon]MDH5704230.1 preprotein translocase subunit Sec61beta [Aigarchaeota archaeon]
MRFFEEESTGIKVAPQLVLVVGAGMLVFVLVAQRLWPLAAPTAAAILASLL